jgi:ribulose-phosphate 3-epimerase
MAQIIPAILEINKTDFLDKMSRVVKLPGVERIQVDFGDGRFVPNQTLDVSEIDPLNPAFHWEAHLMANEPGDFLDYQICGFHTVIVHYEAYPDAGSLKAALEGIKKLGLKSGVAVNPQTPVSVLPGLEADMFLVMGVNPGYQGQEFLPETLDRAKELRQLLPKAVIEVDGGVKASNIRDIAQSGADLVIAGSALVKAADMQEAYEQLQREAGKFER